MKKVLIPLIASFVLVACSQEENRESSTEEPNEPIQEEQEFDYAKELTRVEAEFVVERIERHPVLYEAFKEDEEFREALQNAEETHEFENAMAKYYNADDPIYLEDMGARDEAERVRKEKNLDH
ncbi:hypothetical protein [Halalkalibacterium ligniniphilum]|uniref:hypothetical protein n=1 Tax=Halalkalibacterium ligniniphilum TaxID=1134413 RepID=UPI00034D6521|nr:hypothetical protein [Halalkalibacterium ligniniphilum]